MSEQMERKTFPFFATKIDSDLGIVTHVVAVMGNVDYGNDVIHPGAFTKTIAERGGKIRVLDNHNRDSIMSVVGKPIRLWEVSRGGLPLEVLERFPEATGGLMAETQFLMDTPEGKGAFVRIKEGAVDEYSIGYDALDVDYSTRSVGDEDVDVRNLRTIRLWEYGPVIWGMNSGTMTLSAKSDDPAESCKDGEPIGGGGKMESKPAPEVTENTIRIRVRDPNDFEEDSFATINIGPEDNGIQAVVGVLKNDGGRRVQSYIFDKEKWTVARAQKWVDDHKSLAGPDAVKFVSSPRNRYGTHASYGFKGNYEAAWRCHFSQVGGGALTARAAGPIRGTVRRTEMIAAAMKPPCQLPGTDSIAARKGPKSPLKCTFPQKPSDYGLNKWDSPEGEDEREKIRLTCKDLAVIKRTALAEVKRRAEDREAEEGKSLDFDDVAPVFGELALLFQDEVDEYLDEVAAWLADESGTLPWEKAADDEPVEKAGHMLAALDTGSITVCRRADTNELTFVWCDEEGKRREVTEGELKVGRVLSAANAQEIVSALERLMVVLERAGVDIPGFTAPGQEDGDESDKGAPDGQVALEDKDQSDSEDEAGPAGGPLTAVKDGPPTEGDASKLVELETFELELKQLMEV